jgi:large subunit ribosomal protein L4
MTKLDVLDFKTGSVLESIEVPAEIEAIAENPDYLDFMSNYLYRSKKVSFIKTAKTKTISEIKGTTKKPYKQKGTGNARQGSLRSPQFRGGANIFGPVPVTANYKINKKERQLAKKILLAQLIENSLIKVVDTISGFNKTKDFVVSKNVVAPNSEKVIFISTGGVKNADCYQAGRNVKGLSFDLGLHFNVYKVSNHETVVITKQAITELFSSLFN